MLRCRAAREPQARLLQRLHSGIIAAIPDAAASRRVNTKVTGGTARIWRRWFRGAGRTAREIFYGMTTFGWVRDLRRERAEIEALFVLMVFGDLVGLPVLPPYYALRLLPLVMPMVERWKRTLLRERDWTDLIGLIEGAE